MTTGLMTPQECADVLGVKKRTFLERYATRPDFPARIQVSIRKFYFEEKDFNGWMQRNKQKRPSLLV